MNYVVQPGDTLNQLAARFGVSVQQIIRANNLTPPYILYIGQTLFIPTQGQPGIPSPQPETGLSRRVTSLENRVDRLETRIDRLDRQLTNLDNRLDRLERPRRTP
ncbi:LysM peptidoglycan-binding domain-containing protein [Brevibacillus fulvus]|uniref:LysM repeat protein n=1 Tax=Brevibacillus fulvus TaxID=1125967 RepID=A0A939BSF3_9BACL|nr:LysM peptidoglycan-binding domain-containing protein [Brevibacillus fulvus]MBM7588469.1 LysM repeat protein [Brevibacillus fulvus]